MMENPPIWTPTDSDKKATIDMILVRQFPNAKYRFLNNELVWEDSSPQLLPRQVLPCFAYVLELLVLYS